MAYRPDEIVHTYRSVAYLDRDIDRMVGPVVARTCVACPLHRAASDRDPLDGRDGDAEALDALAVHHMGPVDACCRRSSIAVVAGHRYHLNRVDRAAIYLFAVDVAGHSCCCWSRLRPSHFHVYFYYLLCPYCCHFVVSSYSRRHLTMRSHYLQYHLCFQSVVAPFYT